MQDMPTNETRRERKSHGCLLTTLSVLAVLILIVASAYSIWYGNAKSALDAEIARIRERGEPLWFSDLAPGPIDPAEDGTPLFLLAIDKFIPTSVTVQNLVSTRANLVEDDYQVLAADLQANQETLDYLREALARPYCRVPMDYSTRQPVSLVLDHAQKARDLARLLAAEVAHAVHVGDQPRAVRAIGDLYGLSELLRDESFTISQLVRIAIAAVAQGALEQAVADIDLASEQLIAIDERLAEMDRRFTLAPAIRAERAMAFTTMSHLHENESILDDPGGPGDDRHAISWLAAGPLRPNLMADQAFMLRTLSDFAEAVDRAGLEGQDGALEFQARVQNASKRYVLSRLLMPAVEALRQAGLRHRQKIATARLGIRVDYYFAQHGRFPESLEEVVDQQLDTIPLDLFARRPLVYKILTDGFTIYSPGENGIDDGGGMQPDPTEQTTNFEVHYPALKHESESAEDLEQP